MADKNLSFKIGAEDDASKVFQKLARTAKSEMGKVDDSLDDTRTAGKKAADALTATFDQLDVELTETKAAADKLATALGPELAGKIDSSKAVAEFQRMGLSLEEVEADADELAAALKKADDVSLKHFSSEADAAGGSVKRLHDNSDQSRSVLANMVGNTTQDLGQLSGVAGSAGVAIGQLGEYAADGNISLKNLAKVAGPLGLVTAAGIGVSAAMKRIADRAADSKRQMEGFTEAIRHGRDAVDVFRDALEDTGKLELPSLFGDTEDLVPLLARVGVSVEQFGTAVEGGEASSRQLLDAMKQAGVGGNDLEEVMEALAVATGNYELGAARAKEITALLPPELDKVDKKAKDADDAVEDAGDSMDDAADDADKLQRNLDKVETQWGELMDAIADDQGLLDVHDSFATLKERADEAWYAAASGADDASQKQRDYQTEVNTTKQRVAEYAREVLGLSPDQTTKIIADIDNGSVDRVEKLLVALTKERNAIINVVTKGKSLPEKAAGGPVTAGQPYIVGEKGPEVMVPATNGTIIPHGAGTPTGTPTGVGGVTNINIYMPAGADPAQVVNATRRHQRRNGTLR